jgi:hypothetical protein
MSHRRKIMTRTKLKRLGMISSEKGGVGKSFFGISLIDFLRSSGASPAAYDADGSVGSLLRILGTRDDAGKLLADQDPVVGAGYYNIRAAERNLLLDSISRGDKHIVHDLAGGTLRDIMTIVDAGESVSGLLDAYEEYNYRVTVVHVMSPTAAAVQSIGRHLEAFGDRADHVAVRNLFWGKKFPFWNGFTDGAGVLRGGKTRELFQSMGGVEIDMPALANETFAKMDAENLSPANAARNSYLTLTERSQVAKFRRDCSAAIEPARAFLGL